MLRADRREKMLHRLFVAGEELAEEVARVPVDEDTAEVEDRESLRLAPWWGGEVFFFLPPKKKKKKKKKFPPLFFFFFFSKKRGGW